MPVLEASEIYAGYGETEILHGVSMHLDPGELVAIIGPNGAGKSTLVKTIIGLLKPTRGAISFEGQDITGLNPEQLVLDGLAYVPQSNNTFQSLTVRENLEMGAITRRPGRLTDIHQTLNRLVRPSAHRSGSTGSREALRQRRYAQGEFEERVKEVCSIFPNLKPKLNDRVGSLSGGEQQMVALAKTLILDPRVLLIDEPSAGLAPVLVATIFRKVEEINAGGAAIVLVEQNARKALALADRGYVLEMGRNRFEGPGEALLSNPDVGQLYLGG